MRTRIAAITSLALCAPFSAAAHEQFFSDIEFESWQRHCHINIDRYGQRQECWAVYQKRFQSAGNYEVGFVIVVDERPSPFSFEIRSINLFDRAMELQIDDTEPFKLACHAYSCTPWTKGDAPKIVEQLTKGNRLVLRQVDKENYSGEIVDVVSLDGFVTAHSQ